MARQTEHDIHALFLDRWSPRAFTGEAMNDATLHALFEAARWAPSASNSQPWRFLYGRPGTPAWDLIFDSLIPFNQDWAKRASVLIAVISAKDGLPPGKTERQPLVNHAFDTGAAWQSLALQAAHSGWHAHAMGGFDRDKLRANLGVPANYDLQTVVAVGKLGDKSVLSEALQSREAPSDRQPLSAMVGEGKFAFTN